MKYSIFTLVGILFLTLPAFSELSESDLQRIKEIVKLEVTESELRIRSELKTEIKSAINESEKHKIEHIDTKLKGVDDRLKGVDDKLNLMSAFLVAIMALIVVAIGLPQLIIAIKQRGQEDLKTEITALRTEIEHLKQTVNLQPDST